MKPAVKIDLEDVQSVCESLAKRWPKLTLAEKIDVAARLKAVSKHIDVFDKDVKADIKELLKGEAGEVPGEIFKALCRLDPYTRLNQTLVKASYPKVYEACVDSGEQPVITFAVR